MSFSVIIFQCQQDFDFLKADIFLSDVREAYGSRHSKGSIENEESPPPKRLGEIFLKLARQQWRCSGEFLNRGEKLEMTYTQRYLFELLLNQTDIRLYSSFSNWFGTRRTSVWFKINRKMLNTIWFPEWFNKISKRFLTQRSRLPPFVKFYGIWLRFQFSIDLELNWISFDNMLNEFS